MKCSPRKSNPRMINTRPPTIPSPDRCVFAGAGCSGCPLPSFRSGGLIFFASHMMIAAAAQPDISLYELKPKRLPGQLHHSALRYLLCLSIAMKCDEEPQLREDLAGRGRTWAPRTGGVMPVEKQRDDASSASTQRSLPWERSILVRPCATGLRGRPDGGRCPARPPERTSENRRWRDP